MIQVNYPSYLENIKAKSKQVYFTKTNIQSLIKSTLQKNKFKYQSTKENIQTIKSQSQSLNQMRKNQFKFKEKIQVSTG